MPARAFQGSGYGTPSRSSATSAASSFTVAERETTAYARIEDLLERVPSLRVLRSSSGSFALEIRGVNALFGEPLLVIDGMQIHHDIGSALTALHPSDVARIDVLRNASAAIYGMRGGNGAVIITTKRDR